jgi:hypothetical protein
VHLPKSGFSWVASVLIAALGCGDPETAATGRVDLYVVDADGGLLADGVLFAGRYSALLPLENPNIVPGTLHGDDPVTLARIEAFSEQVEGANALVVVDAQAHGPAPGAVRVGLTGCRLNELLLAEVQRAGEELCAADDLGRRLRFANVQFARIAPRGPFDIYRDYAVQAIPVLYGAGGCLAGAWICDPGKTGFDGVFIAAYPSIAEILAVARATATQRPGGAYGDASYEDLRLGGAEFLVRNLMDVQALATSSDP